MHTRNRKSMDIKVLNLLAAGLMVAALVLGCNTNVSNGGEVLPEKFTVTFNVNGGNGNLTATVDGKAITPPAQVEKGKNVVFTATPNKKYVVDKWSITPSNALIENGKAEDTTAKVKVTANTTVNVTFKPVYTPVAYADLRNHLTTAQPASDGIYYIEVTGLTASDVYGNLYRASSLGQILKENETKKVALKFGTMPNVTYMIGCFKGCTSLVQVSDIPESVEDIHYCFDGCTELAQVSKIPNSVKDMSYCFRGCIKLERVPNIPDSVKDMNHCFYGCTKLEQVPNIPDGVTNMKECFYGCTKLERVPNLPDSVTDMKECFYGCTKLERVPNLPDSVTDMSYCFHGCTSLTAVPNIPNSVKDMNHCFYGCTKLEQVPKIPDSVTDMNYCFHDCTSLTSVPNIPNSVEDMTSCFGSCTSLVQVSNIPNSVTNMAACFSGCTKLEQVPNIPNSVTNMRDCFYGCTKLEHVPNIPDGVTNMGSCFFYCTSLTSVTLKCEYLDGKFDDAFSGCSSLSAGSIKVPADSLDDYKDNANKMGAKAEWFAKDE